MLRQAFKTVLSNNSKVKFTASLSATSKEKWDLYAGVIIERLPVITKSLTKIENEFLQQLNQIEFENSLKSDFEMRHEKDQLVAELHKKGKLEDMDVVVQQTAQDLKDSWKEESSQYQLQPRLTEADKQNETKSLNRKLENTLILFVEQQIGKGKHLLLPQGKRLDGETLRQTAERVVREKCGDNSINTIFYGNAPCGFYKYKYPVSERKEGIVGAKVFFFRATYKSGQLHPDKVNAKYEWLDKVEMQGKLKGQYADSVSPFLL